MGRAHSPLTLARPGKCKDQLSTDTGGAKLEKGSKTAKWGLTTFHPASPEILGKVGENRQASDVPQLTCLAVFPCRPESPHPSISAPHAKYQTFRCLYNYTNFSLTPAICTLPLLLHNFFTQDGTPEVDPGEIPTAGPSHKLHPGHTWDPAIGHVYLREDGKPPASDNDLSDRAVITPALSIELQVTKPRTQRSVQQARREGTVWSN
ncbi:hypothetical protein Bbelb_405260 [Branchiostoma belcheri]|nr:hypothetical protein Bbelb_405260 [Branchiostoma belcheri]